LPDGIITDVVAKNNGKDTRIDPGSLYLHADGDSFFVACELSVRPELRGLPVIVGADRGIAVAMNTEAKKLGVSRGMPIFKIKKLMPEVVILSHDFDLYLAISKKMRQILSSYFNEIEEYSIDECFALVHPSEVKYFGGEEKLMNELKREIENTLKVTYSLGLARTKALSKLASKLEKPNGKVMLLSKSDGVRALQATSIDDIWGIGSRTIPRLRKLGIKNAFDFVNSSDAAISKDFSKPLLVLKRELAGEQILEVESDTDPRGQKSMQSTSTFRPASTDPKIIWREIAENTEHVCMNAREMSLLSNKVSYFVKTSQFKYFFNEVKMSEYTSDPGTILNSIEAGFLKLLPAKQRIRSTGIILHDLIRAEEAPLDLFGKQKNALKNIIIEQAADAIRQKHGIETIKRASSLRKK
jgi:nucleotidyltransferase/DNA polymerase involved in DNA repair